MAVRAEKESSQRGVDPNGRGHWCLCLLNYGSHLSMPSTNYAEVFFFEIGLVNFHLPDVRQFFLQTNWKIFHFHIFKTKWGATPLQLHLGDFKQAGDFLFKCVCVM